MGRIHACICAALMLHLAAGLPSTATSCHESLTTTAIPAASPTAPYKILVGAGPSIGFNFLPMQARGFNFYVGGQPATYCPQEAVTKCPPGWETFFSGLGGLYTSVPGGQTVFIRRDGSLGFTHAHSAMIPLGAVIGGDLTFSRATGATFGTLGTKAFEADGFMACPADEQSDGQLTYQVFASMSNATVPLGDSDACIKFAAMTYDKVDLKEGAWQYI